MTKAYEDYHNTFMAETTALIELFGGLLQGSRSADEINQQADQHLANLKDAASQYWKDRDPGDADASAEAFTNAYCESCQYHLEHQDCDPDCDLDRQQLKEEVRQAYLNGGRTQYLYNIDGNEYYTTRDGIRHYTRVEG